MKGAIRLCTAVFPSKIDGHRIEALARAPLWEVGLDYLHGTGHGVGAFLNVHEGPCGINARPTKGPLQAGMILSDGERAGQLSMFFNIPIYIEFNLLINQSFQLINQSIRWYRCSQVQSYSDYNLKTASNMYIRTYVHCSSS